MIPSNASPGSSSQNDQCCSSRFFYHPVLVSLWGIVNLSLITLAMHKSILLTASISWFMNNDVICLCSKKATDASDRVSGFFGIVIFSFIYLLILLRALEYVVEFLVSELLGIERFSYWWKNRFTSASLHIRSKWAIPMHRVVCSISHRKGFRKSMW